MKAVIIFAIAAGSFLNGCKSSEASSEASGAPKTEAKTAKDEIVLSPSQENTAHIETQAAVLSDQPDILRVKGHIVLPDNHSWSVGVRSDGLVMVVYAGLGEAVRKGQILARYHADEVREERAHYRTALAELSRAESAAAQAQRNRDRAQRLLELKAGSVQAVEQARQDVVDAQAAVKRAQIEIDRGKDLLEDDLGVKVDPPGPGEDELLDDVPIFAPASGYVIQKNVTPGKTVDRTAVTFIIGDLSSVWMLASVRQADLGGLSVGQTVSVLLPGEPIQRFAGKITNLGQSVDPETRAMEVRIVIDNPRNVLKPEMLADAEIPLARRKPALLISSDAVQQADGQDVVFVRTAPGHFAVRAVSVGETIDGRTPVLDGIQAGDQVVVRGAFILKSQLLKSTLDSE